MPLKLANFFGFRSTEELPTVRLVDYVEGEFKRFTLSRNITKNNIVGFVEKWKRKELRSHKYMESFESDISILSKDSLIKKVNFNTYFETINFNRKNIVVLFYTEWCSHCKKV